MNHTRVLFCLFDFFLLLLLHLASDIMIFRYHLTDVNCTISWCFWLCVCTPLFLCELRPVYNLTHVWTWENKLQYRPMLSMLFDTGSIIYPAVHTAMAGWQTCPRDSSVSPILPQRYWGRYVISFYMVLGFELMPSIWTMFYTLGHLPSFRDLWLFNDVWSLLFISESYSLL